MNKHKNITRRGSSGNLGWQVQVYKHHICFSRFFSDGYYQGNSNALRLAIEWRDRYILLMHYALNLSGRTDLLASADQRRAAERALAESKNRELPVFGEFYVHGLIPKSKKRRVQAKESFGFNGSEAGFVLAVKKAYKWQAEVLNE